MINKAVDALNTDTHRGVYTEELFPTDACTHRSFYTQTCLHTEAFIHRSLHTESFYTQKLLHRQISLYTDDLCDAAESQLYPRFCRLTVISCERVASEISKSQFIHQCLPFDLHLSCERVRHTFVRPTGTISPEGHVS